MSNDVGFREARSEFSVKCWIANRLEFHSAPNLCGGWIGRMTAYRLYTLGSDGHIEGPPTIVECDDNQAAVERAKELLNGKAIEVWERKRLIVRLEPKIIVG